MRTHSLKDFQNQQKENQMPRNQTRLPGEEFEETEAEKELGPLVDIYVDVRDRRMELTVEEKAAKKALTEGMHKHSLKSFRHDGYLAVLEAGEENLKVKTAKDGDEQLELGEEEDSDGE